MKKAAAVLMAVCMLMGLAACQETNPTSATEATKATVSPTQASTVAETMPVFNAEAYSYMLDENGHIKDVKASDYATLPDFSAMVFYESMYQMTFEELQETFTDFVNSYENLNTERMVRNGDSCYIDYEGRFDGVKFEGGSGTDTEVTAGSDEMIDGMLKALVGHYPGDTFEVEATFPNPYSRKPEYAGKKAVFTITINSIIESKADMTDEYIVQHPDQIAEYFGVTGVTTVEELADYCYMASARYNMEEDIRAAAIDGSNITEVPDNAILFEENIYDLYYYSTYGMSFSDFAAENGYSTSLVSGYIEDAAMEDILVMAIVEAQGFVASEDDFAEYFGSEGLEERIATYGVPQLKFQMLQSMAIEYIYSQITIYE